MLLVLIRLYYRKAENLLYTAILIVFLNGTFLNLECSSQSRPVKVTESFLLSRPFSSVSKRYRLALFSPFVLPFPLFVSFKEAIICDFAPRVSVS